MCIYLFFKYLYICITIAFIFKYFTNIIHCFLTAGIYKRVFLVHSQMYETFRKERRTF